jgi:hypothetical protein
LEHPLEIVGPGRARLHDTALSATLADVGQGVAGSFLVLIVVDGDLDALLGELERDGAPDPA